MMNRRDEMLDGSDERCGKVTAVFADSDVSFLLPKGATMGDLAERLAYMAEPHGGLPTALDIRFTA